MKGITFEGLTEIKDVQKRGYEFERLFESVLKSQGFLVKRNSRVAKPRKSDLFASYEGKYFLIECRYESRKMNIADIDDLRSRLLRTTTAVIGCMASMSGFSDEAIAEVASKRDRPILLFNAYEIQRIMEGYGYTFHKLAADKLHRLVSDAEVWFMAPRPDTLKSEDVHFSAPDEFIVSGSQVTPYIGSEVHWAGEHVFARELPDLSWNVLPGYASAILYRVPFETLADLNSLFDTLRDHFGLAGHGTFSIQQSEYAWNGFGVAEFLKQSLRLKERYDAVNLPKIHHSEELCYFETVLDGSLVLTARQRVKNPSNLVDVELEIRLPGTPIDLEPFRILAQSIGESGAYFRRLPETGLDERDVRALKKRIRLTPIARIHKANLHGDQMVSGIVAINPFFSKKDGRESLKNPLFRILERSRLKDKPDSYSPLHGFTKTKLWICDLGDWHGVEDEFDYYYLTRLEATWMTNVIVLRPWCTWNEFVKRSKDRGSPPNSLPVRSRHGGSTLPQMQWGR